MSIYFLTVIMKYIQYIGYFYHPTDFYIERLQQKRVRLHERVSGQCVCVSMAESGISAQKWQLPLQQVERFIFI